MLNRFLTITILFISLGLIISCGNENGNSTALPEGPIESQVQFLVDQDRYPEALDLLREEDSSDRRIMIMVRDTHLLYANWLMHAAESIHMTERMPMALRHFRRVLEIDPENQIALASVNQIESIYQQMNREIPQGVAQQ